MGFSLRQFSEVFKIRDADGQPYVLVGEKTIRVLDPISLLACKLELVTTVQQRDRQDVVHLKILLPCVRAFLDELLWQVDLGQLPAKDWLKIVNQVLKLTTSHRAQRIASKHHINWPEILPLPGYCQKPK